MAGSPERLPGLHLLRAPVPRLPLASHMKVGSLLRNLLEATQAEEALNYTSPPAQVLGHSGNWGLGRHRTLNPGQPGPSWSLSLRTGRKPRTAPSALSPQDPPRSAQPGRGRGSFTSPELRAEGTFQLPEGSTRCTDSRVSAPKLPLSACRFLSALPVKESQGLLQPVRPAGTATRPLIPGRLCLSLDEIHRDLQSWEDD